MLPLRPILVLAGAVALYIGGLLIGMAGAGLQGFSAILSLMLLYTLLLRPVEQWSGPGMAGILRFVGTLLVLVLVTAFLWLLGSALARALAPAPLWLGMAVMLGAIAVSRLVWSPAKEAEINALLDTRPDPAQTGDKQEPRT